MGEETGIGSRKVGSALAREEFAVDLEVFLEHLEPIFQLVAGDLAVLDVHFFEERNAVGHYPRVALARDGAKLVVNRKSFFMGSDNGGEQFAGKLLPEMIEEILQRTADAPMVIRRAENDHVRGNDFAF